MTIEIASLGRTGIPVSRLALGTAPLGDLYSNIGETTAEKTVISAMKAGITLFDTSPFYGHGLAELRLGAGFRQVVDLKPVISTKVGRRAIRFDEPRTGWDRAPNFGGGLPHHFIFDYSYEGTLRSLDQSMLRMGVDRIDIALIHDVDMFTHGAKSVEQRYSEAMDGAYRALDRLRAEKVIGAVGIGVNEADIATRFIRNADLDTVLLAGRYSLLEQPALAEFLPAAHSRKIGVMLGGVFNSGILATGAVPGAYYNYAPATEPVLERVRRIERICAAHGAAVREAALHFVFGHPAVGSVVLGATSPEEVLANVASLSVSLPAALWTDLKAEGLLQADAPVPA
jgi:D-threo-aldose 1-dehydrogenase